MIKLKLRKATGIASIALALLIAGCGGGGGGDTAQAVAGGGGGTGGGSTGGGGTGGGGTGGGGGGTTTPLSITGTAPTNYEWGDLATGQDVYVDRSYTFVSIPSGAQGVKYLRTANDDKSGSDPASITFDVNQSVTVWVGYDARAFSVPDWLQTWSDTGLVIETSDTDLTVFEKDFPAGTIMLGGNESARSMYSVAIEGEGTAQGAPLAIAGSPSSNISDGVTYSFAPVASGGFGALSFSISTTPSWANFNTNTGALTGTPDMIDIGTTTSNIVISVSDGTSTVSLAPFSISVLGAGNGSATLSWTAPTQNADNSALMDLSGYKVYYGNSVGNYPNSVRITNPGVTTAMVNDLAPGSWSFVVTAYDAFGNESGYSNVATKNITQ